jgi:hypothetical protein
MAMADNMIKAVKKHPVRTAAVAAGAIAGAALLRKAVNTAAKVVTVKAVAGAAREVVGAVGSKRNGTSRGSRTGRAKGSRASAAKRSSRKSSTSRRASGRSAS